MALLELVKSSFHGGPAAGHREAALMGLRYSKADQGPGNTIEAQRVRIRVFAERHGIPVVGEYVHEATSAFADKRRIWTEMVERALADAQVGLLLFDDASRFYRNTYLSGAVKHRLNAAGVKVVYCDIGLVDTTTEGGKWLEGISDIGAEAGSIRTRYHTLKGMAQNAVTRDSETGWCYKNGGQPPFGYRTVRVQRGWLARDVPKMKSVWEVDEREFSGKQVWEWARHVLVELVGERGLSYDAIRDSLNGNGVPPSRGRYWNASSIRSLLLPHKLLQYSGYGVWNVHDLRHMKARGTKYRPVEEWVTVPNAHPAIISEEEAERIHAAMSSRAERYGSKGGRKGRGSRFLLSGGLFVCAKCGRNMVGLHNRGHDYYICGSARYYRGEGCVDEAVWIEKDALESLILEQIDSRYGDSVRLSEFLKHVEQRWRTIVADQDAAVDDQERQLAKLKQRAEHILDEVEERLDKREKVPESLYQRLSQVESDVHALEAERPERVLAIKQAMPSLQQMMARYQKFTQIMARGTPEERRDMVRTFLHRAELDPEAKKIRLLMYEEPSLIFVVAGAGFEPATSGL